jgi:DNA-binding transcriptional ArsR family regulator
MLLSYMAKHDPSLDRILHALADPTRRGMLEMLSAGDATVGDLARPSGFALPTILRHLAVLQEAGLIDTDKRGRARLCAVRPQALAPLAHWMDGQRDLWEGRLDRLETYVTQLMKDRADDA